MFFNFAEDWFALLVVALFIGFVVYAAINGKKNQDKSRNDQKK